MFFLINCKNQLELKSKFPDIMDFARLLKIFVFRYRSGIERGYAAHISVAALAPASLLHQGVHISLRSSFLTFLTSVADCKH